MCEWLLTESHGSYKPNQQIYGNIMLQRTSIGHREGLILQILNNNTEQQVAC